MAIRFRLRTLMVVVALAAVALAAWRILPRLQEWRGWTQSIKKIVGFRTQTLDGNTLLSPRHAAGNS